MAKPPKRQPGDAPQAVIERAAGMLRAGGDPARLRILALLMSGERQVTDLAERMDAEMSTTSQRLKTLLNENLVARRRDGRDMYYRLADAHVATLVRNVLDHADPDASHPD